MSLWKASCFGVFLASVLPGSECVAATLEVCAAGCAYATIQSAIDGAADGDIVLVHDGRYLENIDFTQKSLTLRSVNGPDATIIDGQNVGRVVTIEGSASAVLDGLQIVNGITPDCGGGVYSSDTAQLTITNCTIADNSACSSTPVYLKCNGGGVHVRNARAVSIAESTFLGNVSGTSGGGLGTYQYGEDPDLATEAITITGCAFVGNYASSDGSGGGIDLNGGSISIVGSTIKGNIANNGGGVSVNANYHSSDHVHITDSTIQGNVSISDGGGIWLDAGSAELARVASCRIAANTAGGVGGGVFAQGTSVTPLALERNSIVGNVADKGAGIYVDARFSALIAVSNSVIAGNSAEPKGSGGGVYARNTSTRPLRITNCTISGNSVGTGGGGGLYVESGYGSRVDVVNSIVYGNEGRPADIRVGSNSTLKATYSDVGRGWSGRGNVDVVPAFVSPRLASQAPTTRGDYHLQSSSALVGLGTGDRVAYPLLPADDVDGQSRPSGAYAIGADEPSAEKPVVTLSDMEAIALEGGEPVVFRFTRSGSLAAEMRCRYEISGTAANATDYPALSGYVTIPAGERRVDLAIPLSDDAAPEATETIVLKVKASKSYQIGSPSTATVMIVDNE